MPVDLRTIEDVPLVSTGTYALASGVTTFTAEDLAAAVAAAADATVPAPRVKLGHADPRFDEAVASGQLDGEPAFGIVANMRLSDDGQTIIGDLENVPAWLADNMPSSFPGRSIEGGFGFEAPSGRKYEFVISALALLGVQWPGVTSLADLQEVLETNGTAPEDADALVAASGSGSLERTVSVDVSAGLDVDLVRRRFVDALDSGEYAVPEGAAPGFTWWPRSLRFEDDGTPVLIAEDGEGNLFRTSFTVDGNDVTFSPASAVVEQYVPVAAAAGDAPRAVLAAWGSRDASRPVSASATEEDSPMTDEQRRALAVALGQPEDTPEDRLHEITAARAAEHVVETPPEGGSGGDEGGPGEGTPEGVTIPEGMVLVDSETLDTLRTGAESGLAVAARLDAQDRDSIIARAIRDEGRIAASSRESWEQRWERDPDGTRTLLTADVSAGGLPVDVIPVGMREVGRSGDGENDTAPVEAEHDAFMARHFPQAHARLSSRGNGSGVRVRQEV